MEPQVILKDLMAIFQPTKLPNHTPTYFKKMNDPS
jgi:hypothetical protein